MSDRNIDQIPNNIENDTDSDENELENEQMMLEEPELEELLGNDDQLDGILMPLMDEHLVDGMWDEEYQSETDEHSDDTNSSSSSNDVLFDTTLPSRHEYLGQTEEVPGRTIVDEDDNINIPLLLNSVLRTLILVPWQTVPITIFNPTDISMIKNVIAKDRLFGIVHTEIGANGTRNMATYGTTAEIYEYHDDDRTGGMSIKAKGRQRFKVLSTRREVTGCVVAHVKIMPDVRMDPMLTYCRLTCLDKFTLPKHSEDNGAQSVTKKPLKSLYTPNWWKVRKHNSLLTHWPSWVYDQYDDQQIACKVVNEVATNTMIPKFGDIKIPKDPHELSNWAAINLPFEDHNRLTLLSLNTTTQRLRYMLSVISKCKQLECISCKQVIAYTSNIFSMSVEGPQGMFVNDSGYVHEMFTTKAVSGLSYLGPPSTRHSWFTGYAWTIANCSGCHNHVGWKFTSTKSRLKPRKFYGITRKSVRATIVAEENGIKNVM